MRDFLALLVLLAGTFVLVASVVALVRPLPKLRMDTRKRALAGLGVAIGLLFVAEAIAPGPALQDRAAGTPAATPSSAPSPAGDELTDEQDAVVSFIRNAVSQTVLCDGSTDQTQSEIDKVNGGRSRPIDVYQEAKQAIKDCGAAITELQRADLTDRLPAADRSLGDQALASCEQAAGERKAAMEMVHTILDGDDRLSNASKYLDHKEAAANAEATCRLYLLGLAERASVPDRDVEFAKP